MRKKLIGLIAVLVVFAVVLGVYFLFGTSSEDAGPEASPTPTAVPKDVILKDNLENAKYITVQHADGSQFKLEHKRVLGEEDKYTDQYVLLSAEDTKVSEEDVGTIFSIMVALSGKPLSAEEQAKAQDGDYGFDKATIVTLEKADGTNDVLEVGDALPDNSGGYVRKQGESKIYIVTKGEWLYLRSTVHDLKNLYLFVAGENDFINTISMTRKGQFQYTIEGTVDENDIQDWKVTAPVTWGMTLTEEFLKFPKQFYNLKASQCLGETEDWKQYGLDVPAYEVKFKVGRTEYKLALGNIKEEEQDGSRYYYARWNDGTDIYLLNTSGFEQIDRPVIQMISNLVTSVGYYELTRFEFERNGVNQVFDIEGKENRADDIITYKGKSFANTTNPELLKAFQNVYKSALSLYAYEFDSEAKPELKDPEITFRFHQKGDKGILTVQYVRRDADRFYIFVDGKYTGCLAQTAMLDKPHDDLTPGLNHTWPKFETEFQNMK